MLNTVMQFWQVLVFPSMLNFVNRHKWLKSCIRRIKYQEPRQRSYSAKLAAVL